MTYLKEAFEPPDLEHALTNEDNELEDAPPLDAGVGALSRVPVCSLTNDNVALFILYLRDEFRHLANCRGISIIGVYDI